MKIMVHIATLLFAVSVMSFVPQVSFAQQEEYEKKKKEWEQQKAEYEKRKAEAESEAEQIKLENKVKALSNDGFQAYKARQYQRSIGLFLQALEINPTFVRAYYGLGLGYVGARKAREALQAYERAIEIDPSYVSAYYAQGSLLQRLKRYPESLASYKKCAELDPENYKALYGLGSVYATSEPPDHQKAADAFSKAVKIKTDYALAYNALGFSLMEIGKTRQAIDALNSAVKNDPQLSESYFRLSKAHNDIGQYREGLDAALKCIDIKTKQKRFYAPAHFEAGRAYMELGNSANAIKQFELAKKDNSWREFSEYYIEEIKRNSGGTP